MVVISIGGVWSESLTGRHNYVEPSYENYMLDKSPEELTPNELRARRQQVRRIAHKLGFLGRIRYAHAYSRSGGATYARGIGAEDDRLTVYAEAFDRNANPLEFSLEAIIAHERGHQLIVRHPRISKLVGSWLSLGSEEILASILGGMICREQRDRGDLYDKAIVELIPYVGSREVAYLRVMNLRDNLEKFL